MQLKQTSLKVTDFQMRIISSILLFLFFSLAIHAQTNEKIDFLNEGDILPEFSIPLENGDTISSFDLHGKVVVFVFFATWCSPCLKELPHVQKEIWEKYKNHNNFQLFVVGREHKLSEINEFKSKNNYTFPCIADTNRSIFSIFAKQNIPRMYLINKNGKIIKMTGGFTPSLFSDFLKLLEEEIKS